MFLKKSILKTTKYDKLFVILAGPLANMLMAVFFIFIPMQQQIKEIIVYSNILLFIVNLIPISPLDGGRILYELLLYKQQKFKAIAITQKVTYVFIIILTALASGLILYYENIGIFAGIVFLWYLFYSEYKKNKYREIAYKTIYEEKIDGKQKNM